MLQLIFFLLSFFGVHVKFTVSNGLFRYGLLGYSELIIFPIELHSDSTLFGA